MLNKVTFPLFSSIQNDNVRLKSIYKKIMQMVIFLVAPILIFMAVLAEPLFRLLLTEKWLPAVPYFQILCANGILFPIHSYNLTILKVKGRSDLFLKLEIIKKVVIAVIILISFHFGIFGLLYGSVISSIFCFFINTHYSGRFLNYTAWEQAWDIIPIVLLALLSGSAIFLFDYFLRLNQISDFLRLAAGGILGIASFIGTSFLFKIQSLFELKNIIARK